MFSSMILLRSSLIGCPEKEKQLSLATEEALMHRIDLVDLAIDGKRDSFERHQSIGFDFRSPADVLCKNGVVTFLHIP